MLGYAIPLAVTLATIGGGYLASGSIWLSLFVGVAVSLLMPYGDLRGKALFLRLINLEAEIKSRRRRKYRKHRYYASW